MSAKPIFTVTYTLHIPVQQYATTSQLLQIKELVVHDPSLLSNTERNAQLGSAATTLRWLNTSQDSTMVYRTTDIADGINRSRWKVWRDLRKLCALGVLTYGSSGRYGIYVHLDKPLATRWLGGAPDRPHPE
jgi:hypothetical protein